MEDCTLTNTTFSQSIFDKLFWIIIVYAFFSVIVYISKTVLTFAFPESSLFSFAMTVYLQIGLLLAFLYFFISLFTTLDQGESIFKKLKCVFSSLKSSVTGIVLLFFFSGIFGLAVGYFNPELFDFLMDSMDLPDVSSWDLVSFIFFNNAKVAFMVLLFGFMAGILPLFVVFSNGITLGVVSEYISRTEGVLFLAAGLLPHGIIELPVILLSAAIGFNTGVLAVQTLFLNGKLERLKMKLNESFWFFFLICVPLLLLASIIEVFGTGWILETFF